MNDRELAGNVRSSVDGDGQHPLQANRAPADRSRLGADGQIRSPGDRWIFQLASGNNPKCRKSAASAGVTFEYGARAPTIRTIGAEA